MTDKISKPLLAALAIGALSTIPWLGSYGLLPEEARYAEIGREMLTSGDWLVPRLNGVSYFEKPPLTGWLAALALAGMPAEPEWALRLVPAASSWICILAVVVFAFRAAGAQFAAAAGISLAVAPFPLGFARVYATDGPFTAAITVALALLGLQAIGRDGRAGRMLGIGVALAVAALARSPIVAYAIYGPVAVACAMAASGRSPRAFARECFRWILVPGLVSAAIAAPWFVMIQLRDPAFFEQFFVLHHFGRIGAAEEDKMLHREPVYFYIPVVVGGACAAMTLIFPAIGRAAGRIRAALRAPGRGFDADPAARALLYSCAAAAWIFVLFTILAGKRAPYQLPAFPWIAVLLGALFVESGEQAARRARALALWMAPLALAAAALGGLWLWNIQQNAAALPPGVSLCAVFLFTGAFAAPAWWAWRGRPGAGGAAGAVLLAAFMALFASRMQSLATTDHLILQIAGRSVEINTATLAQRELALAAQRNARKGDLIAHFGRFRHALNFYCNNNLILFGSPGELGFGYSQIDDGTVKSETAPARYKLSEVNSFLRDSRRILLLGDWDDFFTNPPGVNPEIPLAASPARDSIPLYVLARHGDLVVVANQR